MIVLHRGCADALVSSHASMFGRHCVQVMCIVFSIGLGLWCYNLYQHRNNAHRIHYIMTALGTFKVLTLLCECLMYHYIRVTGSPDGWNIVYYMFTMLRGVLLFTVIILIGTGWSYMTPFLGDNNRKILMLVIPLQVQDSDVVQGSHKECSCEPTALLERMARAAFLPTVKRITYQKGLHVKCAAMRAQRAVPAGFR